MVFCFLFIMVFQETESLIYACSECKGRTMSINPLILHLERSHKIFRAPNQFNHITKSMIRYWESELGAKGYASCLHITKGKRDCFYFDLKILGIVEHSQCCKGVRFELTIYQFFKLQLYSFINQQRPSALQWDLIWMVQFDLFFSILFCIASSYSILCNTMVKSYPSSQLLHYPIPSRQIPWSNPGPIFPVQSYTILF